MPQGWTPVADYGTRADGSKKGAGFLGALPRPDGSVSSEISIGVNIDGREVEIPTLVPTLTPQEKQWLLSNDISDPTKIPPAIIQKAVDYARPRLKAGQSPFADASESPAGWTPVPEEPNFKTEVIGDTSKIGRLVGLLPTLGGAAGGVIGGIGGTVGGFGVGGVPGAVAGAGLGGITGESLRQLIQKLRGVEPPGTAMDAATDLAKEGGLQAVYELGGQGLMRGASAAGRSLIENAVRPPIGLVKEFPNVMETIVKNRLPVGRGLVPLPGAKSGSQQAKALLQKSGATTRNLLKEAGEAGTTFEPQQMAAKQISDLAASVKDQPISGPDLKRLSTMVLTYLDEHGAAMTPQAVKDMKRAAQTIAKPVFKAQQAGGGVSADQALGARFNEAVASGAKDALETIKGIAASEAQTQSLIGATRAIRQAELRRLPLAAEGISGAAAVVGAMLQPGSGLDDKLRNGATAWLIARGLASPRSISRQGLALTAEQTQQLLRQFPRLGDAVMKQLSVGQTGAGQ